jgi:hypothetical protein
MTRFAKRMFIKRNTADQIKMERAKADGRNSSPYSKNIIFLEKTLTVTAIGRDITSINLKLFS